MISAYVDLTLACSIAALQHLSHTWRRKRWGMPCVSISWERLSGYYSIIYTFVPWKSRCLAEGVKGGLCTIAYHWQARFDRRVFPASSTPRRWRSPCCMSRRKRAIVTRQIQQRQKRRYWRGIVRVQTDWPSSLLMLRISIDCLLALAEWPGFARQQDQQCLQYQEDRMCHQQPSAAPCLGRSGETLLSRPHPHLRRLIFIHYVMNLFFNL